MFRIQTLLYGLGFGTIDSIALPIVKGVSTGWSKLWMTIPVLMYAATPLILLNALATESLTIMNLVWDLSSDLLVTFIGLIVLAEKLSPIKLLGVFTSFISLFLMTYENDGFDNFLSHNYNRIYNGVRNLTSNH